MQNGPAACLQSGRLKFSSLFHPPARGSLKYDTAVWITATVTGIFGAAGFGDGRLRCVEWASGGRRPLDVMIESSGHDQACEFSRITLRIRFRWSAARLRTTRLATQS
jgi:hypothetical protein